VENARGAVVPTVHRETRDLKECQEIPGFNRRIGVEDRASFGGKGVADKGRRSFLRRVERQGEYNVEGTRCQCLFNVLFK